MTLFIALDVSCRSIFKSVFGSVEGLGHVVLHRDRCWCVFFFLSFFFSEWKQWLLLLLLFFFYHMDEKHLKGSS